MKPGEESFTVECGGCGRFLMRKQLVELTPPTEEERRGGILGWEKVRYWFRPWVATVLTRTKTVTVKTPGYEGPAKDVAQVCSRPCLDKVLATWTYDKPDHWELRGFGRRILGNDVLGNDVLAFTAGEWPLPAEPSDAWIEAGGKNVD